ncbi:hypothetical protein IVA79_24785 [Bradyrhizobium sp. 138]|uniref:hypothetical protein n=1 Tax=Bradyrhizobium sp. 138 TaxID=2782615 RepID=UPI001FF87DD0|nr:hypothetical protein [Bradyrhizobium sp. 138]MCK1737101.1 hypothetical protein [Bradyrhizobium sp. 138]
MTVGLIAEVLSGFQMTVVPLTLTFAFLLFWTIVGWSLIAITAPGLGPLRSLFLAPTVGVAATLLPTFWLSVAGIPVEAFARSLCAVVLFVSICVWLWRWPAWLRQDLIFVLPVVVSVVLSGFPSLRFGLDWLANANDDWANYNLSAIRLLHNGFFQQPSINALRSGQDYPGYLWFLVVAGNGRPGADLLLSFFAAVSGKSPFLLFMPLILAFHGALCGAAAAVALPAFDKRRYLFAGLCLTALAPLSLYAVHQQLIAQVIGLAFMCGTASLAFTPFTELRSKGHLFLTAVVAAAYWLIYPETVPFFVMAFLLFHVWHFRRNDWGWRSWRSVLLLTVVTALLAAPYLVSFFLYMLSQLHGSASQGVYEGVSIFPYFIVPSGLSILFGFLPLGASDREPFLSFGIAASIALGAVALGGVVEGFRRRVSFAAFLAIMCIVTAVVVAKRNDFGLFKIAMFAQSFIWFAIIFAVAHFKQKIINYLVVVASFCVCLTDARYVASAWRESSGGGNAIPHGSSDRVLTRLLDDRSLETCNVTYETPLPPLMKILGAREGCARTFEARPSFFNGRLDLALQGSERNPLHKLFGITQYTARSLEEIGPKQSALPFAASDVDGKSVTISRLTKEYNKTIPGGAEVDIWSDRDASGNRLTLIDSNLGSYYYLPETGIVSVYAPEQDIYFAGKMFAAAGRYLLFRVNNPSAAARLQLSMTSSTFAGTERRLPPVKVVGEAAKSIGFLGYGAGRVVSDAVVPIRYDGKFYILLDMAVDAQPLATPRRGLMKLYGQDVPLDYRQMTGLVRRIRLVDANDKLLQPPSRLEHFPADLANDALQFSGMYEDGWLGDQGFFVLSSETAKYVRMRGQFQRGVGLDDVDLTLSVDGGGSVTKHLEAGSFELWLPVKAGASRIQFKFSNIGRLPPGDARPAVALLTSLSMEDGMAVGQHAVSAFASAGSAVMASDGIYADGWEAPQSTLLVQSPVVAGKVVLSGMVPSNLGLEDQKIEIKGGSEGAIDQTLQPGDFEIQVPVAEGPVKLEINFIKSNQLPNGDGRRVSALLRSIRIVP